MTLTLGLATDALAHGAVCTVATDDVLGFDRDLGAVGAANRHHNRLVVGLRGLDRDGLVAVIGAQAARRVPCELKRKSPSRA